MVNIFSNNQRVIFIIVTAAIVWSISVLADNELPRLSSDLGSIVNTRHNLTVRQIGPSSVNMNPYRNDYGEVCVYCHTPHGANEGIQIPMWNRTLSSATYSTYDELKTSSLEGTMSQPGAASMTCLSCHDGTVAIDSIINMPGSGSYDAGQKTAQNNAFLNTWDNESGPDASVHITLLECLLCHSPDAGIVGTGATDFRIAVIGTDLTDDHPIGVQYGAKADFNLPTGVKGSITFFDSDGDSRPDSDEIRMYNSGAGAEVECASCHDPHGVPSAGVGSKMQEKFLRQDNIASNVCTVCHVK